VCGIALRNHFRFVAVSMEFSLGFPWFSQLLHGSAGLIQMNYLSQNVSVVAFFWVCGLNSISLANEFDYYT